MSFSRGTAASNVFLCTGGDASTYIFYSAQRYNANKFKDINTDNYYFYRSTLTGNYFKKAARHKNEMPVGQFSSVNPFTTFGYHNSNPASSFGTTLQNSTVREAHIKSCKLSMCYASPVPTDKQDAEDKSWVWKPQVTLQYLLKLRI